MADDLTGKLSLRPLREEDLPTLFEIQLDEEARHQAAFVGQASQDRDGYVEMHRKHLHDAAITIRVLERNGFVRIGSEDSFAEGRQATVTELIYVLAD